jgi:hypothetical protein
VKLWLQLAISLAISLNLTHVIFEGDSQIVILALQNPSVAQDWRISPIIQNSIDSIHHIFPGPLGKLIEVQTSVPIIWHEGPQLEFLLEAFPVTLLVYFQAPQSKSTAAKIHLYFLCVF